MPRIRPFKAIRPAREHAEAVASVPYDVVSRAEAVALADRNPSSFLHVVRPDIDLPAETSPYADEVYEAGHASLERLLSEGVLHQDQDSCLYVYRQIMNGVPQIGLVCCCHIDDYADDLIRKHEKTRPDKEEDRTRHVLTLNVHAGPVFLSYRGDETINAQMLTALQTQSLYDFTADDGVQHTVWRITETGPFLAVMSAIPVFYVADGHHRSASAWRAGTERRNANRHHTGCEEYNWFLAVLFPADQLKIMSYNRVVRDLNGLTPDGLKNQLSEIGLLEATNNPVPAAAGSFCFYVDGSWYRLTVPVESIKSLDVVSSLDVAILEDRVLRPILGIDDVRTDKRIDFVGGIRGTEELERLIDSGDWTLAVSMYPTSMDQLMSVSDAGEIMPPKSTWFEPKLRSGLLVHSLD